MHIRLEQLISLRDGAPVAAEAAVHVRECPGCRTEVARLSRWRQRWIDLPVLDAPAGAWQKIAARLDEPSEPTRHWQWAPVAGIGVAASLVAAVVLVTLRLQTPEPAAPAPTVSSAPMLTQLQSQSRYLEQVMQAMNAGDEQGVTTAGTAATVAALEDRIALVDYAINQANGAPQPPTDLTALWQQRVNLMQSLAAVRYAQASDASWGQ